MKKLLILSIGVFVLIPLISQANSNFSDKLSGKILLQVEEKGEAWYIEPTTKERVFLGRPDDAFRVMRELGLGISEKDFNSFNFYAPKKLSGSILLRVEANGEAYYVNPVDLKMHFLGKPADSFEVMRNLGLGVTNQDLEKIVIKNFSNSITQNEISDNPVSNDNDTYKCNGVTYSKCSDDLVFYCPTDGKAVCLNGEKVSTEEEKVYIRDMDNIMKSYDEKINIITSLIDEQTKLRDSRISYLNFLLSSNQELITTDVNTNKIIYEMEEYYKEAIREHESSNVTWSNLKDLNYSNYLNVKNLHEEFKNSSSIYSKNDYEKILNKLIENDNALNQVVNGMYSYTDRIKTAINDGDELISTFFSTLEDYNNLQDERYELERQASIQNSMQNNYIIQINQYNYNMQRISPIQCSSSNTFGITTTRCY